MNHPSQTKGRQTRAAILDAALALAAREGVEGLSIGALADAAEMSKSGVYAHFGSREELQLAVIREYHDRFEAEVFTPALRERRGLPRLREMFDRWLRRVSNEAESGCLYVGGAVEFDARPGPVRDLLAATVNTWRDALGRAVRLAADAGHLRADVDAAQVLFELHGLVLALHHDARFLRDGAAAGRARAGFDRIVGGCVTPAGRDASPAFASAPIAAPAPTTRGPAGAVAPSSYPQPQPQAQAQPDGAIAESSPPATPPPPAGATSAGR